MSNGCTPKGDQMASEEREHSGQMWVVVGLLRSMEICLLVKHVIQEHTTNAKPKNLANVVVPQ